METAALVIVSVANLGMLLAPSLRKKREDADSIDDKVVKLLKENIAALEKKLLGIEEEQKTSRDELASLRASNSLMTQILQGRDEKTQRFQDEGFRAMAKLIEVEKFLHDNLPIKK